MTQFYALLIAAALGVTIIVLMPQVMSFRISVLKVLRLSGLADWHQRHFQFLVKLMRVIVGGIVILLLYLAYNLR
ncbi:MAG: hypothetical protein KKA42_05165 [candidate division Zixibacteria bacterium]|nr:hypothetical protein [candidate division Zixibacteria bacterium]